MGKLVSPSDAKTCPPGNELAVTLVSGAGKSICLPSALSIPSELRDTAAVLPVFRMLTQCQGKLWYKSKKRCAGAVQGKVVAIGGFP